MTSFDKLVQEAKLLGRKLRKCAFVSMSESSPFPVSGGVYVISDRGIDLYAGLASNLKRRLRQHTNGKQIQSAFTLKLASYSFKKKHRSKQLLSIVRLRVDGDFLDVLDVYARTANKVKQMKVRYVETDDPKLRIILEVYAGMLFNTKWNDFNKRVLVR